MSTLTLLAGTSLACGGEAGSDENALAARLVHRFDFNERPAGNLEDVPKFWERLRTSGFPLFAGGIFDADVGAAAPPSFHLSSSGRNVAYLYRGSGARVRTGGVYRVEGLIRPDKLKDARACLSAHYVDRDGQPLLDTLVRSRYVGGADEGDGWIGVELSLPQTPPDAYAIALGAWVVQVPVWNDAPAFGRPIVRSDVHGGAWFDDLSVYRMPRIELDCGVVGCVFGSADPPELHLVLSDPQGGELRATLTVQDAEGAVTATRALSSTVDETHASRRIDLSDLPPGLFRATLDVSSRDAHVVTRSVTFARLSPAIHGEESLSRSFGVVLESGFRADEEAGLALLLRQGVRAVKVPIWSGSDDPALSESGEGPSERFLQSLNRRGFALTGVLGGPPRSLRPRFALSDRPLLDLFKDASGPWGEELAAVAAPHAGVFRWWQLGVDGGSAADWGSEGAKSAENLREALHRFITAPRLAAPVRATDAGQRGPFDQVTVAVEPDVAHEWIASHIQSFREAGYDPVSAYVAPLPEAPFPRGPRLAEWAQRLITTRHARAEPVFVPQTWHVRAEAERWIAEPTEAFILLRTLAGVLNDAVGEERMFVADGVECLAFRSGGTSILALWDAWAPPQGRDHAISLGDADQQIDLWGRSTPLPRDARGRQIVRLSPSPVLVTGVDRNLIRFATSWSIEPSHVESGREVVRHRLRIRHRESESLSGQGVLDGPESVEFTPRSFSFQLPPDEDAAIEVTARYSHTEPAGRKRLLVKATVGPEARYLEIPLFVEVGVSDLDVTGSAVVGGSDLVLRHVVSNRSSGVLSLRSSASVPGRERQYRPVANLRPGETQTVEYRFTQSTDLVGRRVRLMLHELNDGPRVHTLELTVP